MRWILCLLSLIPWETALAFMPRGSHKPDIVFSCFLVLIKHFNKLFFWLFSLVSFSHDLACTLFSLRQRTREGQSEKTFGQTSSFCSRALCLLRGYLHGVGVSCKTVVEYLV